MGPDARGTLLPITVGPIDEEQLRVRSDLLGTSMQSSEGDMTGEAPGESSIEGPLPDLHLARRFWNQTCTALGVMPSFAASIRRAPALGLLFS